jgi:hypothetical protein
MRRSTWFKDRQKGEAIQPAACLHAKQVIWRLLTSGQGWTRQDGAHAGPCRHVCSWCRMIIFSLTALTHMIFGARIPLG